MAMVPTAWPVDWNKPTVAIVEVVEQASKGFGTPTDLIYGVIAKESNFRPKLMGKKNATNSETFRKSYEKYRDMVIPGKNPRKLTWGEVFQPEDWTAYGLMQLLPFHIYGKTGGVPVGSPITDMLKVRPNVLCAVAYLKALRLKYPDSWDQVLKVYNGSWTYVREVAANIEALKAVTAAV